MLLDSLLENFFPDACRSYMHIGSRATRSLQIFELREHNVSLRSTNDYDTSSLGQNDSQSSNTEFIDLERDHTRYPEKLDAFLYTIGLDQIPGWKMDSRTRKVSLSKAGRSWVRRMCYLLGRKNMDCNPFLEHLGTIFDAEEMIRIMEVTEKTIDKVYMKKGEHPNNAEVFTDEESLKLAKIANFLKYTDVPGAYIDRVSSRKLIGPESIPFLQKDGEFFLLAAFATIASAAGYYLLDYFIKNDLNLIHDIFSVEVTVGAKGPGASACRRQAKERPLEGSFKSSYYFQISLS
uniref:Uncharacterized protein n=1 Tax=Romanomermis culicivorax TaxID=13658 RepID=A0A915L9V2_ROMCU